MKKMIVAGILLAFGTGMAVGIMTAQNTDITTRYEFRCDTVEHNYDTNVDWAVIEVYDTQTDQITMMDIELRK